MAASFLDESLVVDFVYGVWEVGIAVERPRGERMRLLSRKARASREAAPEGDRSENRRKQLVIISTVAPLLQLIVNEAVSYEKSQRSWMNNLILLLKVMLSVINYLFFLSNRTDEKY